SDAWLLRSTPGVVGKLACFPPLARNFRSCRQFARGHAPGPAGSLWSPEWRAHCAVRASWKESLMKKSLIAAALLGASLSPAAAMAQDVPATVAELIVKGATVYGTDGAEVGKIEDTPAGNVVI